MPRVISGILRGRRLATLSGEHTRPTSDKVKEAVFSSLGDLAGDSFLDLFAGCGQMAIEAYSRGANEVVLVESNQHAFSVICQNLKQCNLQKDDVLALKKRALDVVMDWSEKKTFSIIYADPPWTELNSQWWQECWASLPRIMNEDSVLYLEIPIDCNLTSNQLLLSKEYQYGRIKISKWIKRGLDA